jgi:putative ABC transport system permease protein
MAWFKRLLNVGRAERLSRDIDSEMAFHIDELTDRLQASGWSRADAAREARRRFGNVTTQKERAHDVDVARWLESSIADVRYALRSLRANPVFSTIAILSLALGIGANSAVFSLTNAVVLRSLPVADPEGLLQVTHEGAAPPEPIFTNPQWEQIRDRRDILAESFAYNSTHLDLSSGGESRSVRGAWVSGSFFDVLGVRAAAGRLLEPSDDFRGCPAVAAVSGGFADRMLGGAASAVGQALTLDGIRFQVVGVSDPRFFGVEVGRNVDVYVPLCSLALRDGPKVLDLRGRWNLLIFGRPASGLGMRQVRAALRMASPAVMRATVSHEWGTASQQEYLDIKLSAQPGANGFSQARADYSLALYTLMGVVALVLLIACANIANLLMARSAAREREIAIRVAIGAGRGRVLRQMLTESVLLAILGAAVGLLFAHWASQLIVGTLYSNGQPLTLDLSLDYRVLAFTTVVATATGILLGVGPALRASRVDPQTAMKSGGRGTVGTNRRRAVPVLIASQLAITLALLACAGLLLGTFRALSTNDFGFRRHGVLIVNMDFRRAGVADSMMVQAQREMLARLRALRGVVSASGSFSTPVSGAGWNEIVVVPGRQFATTREAIADFNEVTDGFFSTTGTTLLAGRDFDATWRAGAPRVAIVNLAMARRFFGTDNPIGRRFSTQVGDTAGTPMQIIGVVRDAKYMSLTELQPPVAYEPLGQGGVTGSSLSYQLLTEADPTALIQAVRSLVRSTNPLIALDFRTMAEQLAVSLARPRLMATLSGFFGGLALLLALIGFYGTISYDVARRRNELGVRVALGATTGQIIRLVAGEAGRIILGGVVAGLVIALASTRLVASFLFGVAPTDAVTFGAATALLALVGLGAALAPAWRAARLDPVKALRPE